MGTPPLPSAVIDASRGLRVTVTFLALVALLACAPGDEAREPPPASAPTIEIEPVSGPGGTWVDVRADGFPAGDSVELGLGPPESEYEVVEGDRTGPDGSVDAIMQVPDWADTGERYVFVVATLGDAPGGPVRAVSDPFTIDAAGESEQDVASATGTLTATGVECPTLETDDGTVFTLSGDMGSFGTGDRVRVFGTPAEMSICMQGVTLMLDSIVEVSGGGP